jgi:hypothetical protein
VQAIHFMCFFSFLMAALSFKKVPKRKEWPKIRPERGGVILMPEEKIPERRSGLRPSENFQNGAPGRSITKIPLLKGVLNLKGKVLD